MYFVKNDRRSALITDGHPGGWCCTSLQVASKLSSARNTLSSTATAQVEAMRYGMQLLDKSHRWAQPCSWVCGDDRGWICHGSSKGAMVADATVA